MKVKQDSLWHELKGILIFFLIIFGGAALAGLISGLICLLIF